MALDLRPITGSTNVTFVVNGSDPMLSLEVDSRVGGYNDGLQGFKSEDEVAILVYYSKGANYTLVSSVGNLRKGAPSGRILRLIRTTVIEMVTFNRSYETQVAKYPAGSITVTPMGGTTVMPKVTGKTLRLPTNVSPPNAAVFKCEYTPTFDVWTLSGVTCPTTEPNLEVLVFGYGDGVVNVD